MRYKDIKPGMKFKALKNIAFIDETSHVKGNIYIVKPGEEDYYYVCQSNYEFIKA